MLVSNGSKCVLLALAVVLLLACLPAVGATQADTRVGPFLAALFRELEAPDTMPALGWAAIALRHGMPTVGDLLGAEARASADPSDPWAAFMSVNALVALGVPAAAVLTIHAALKWRMGEVERGSRPRDTTDASIAPPPPKKHASITREVRNDGVLPNDLTDLATVLARLRKTIGQYKHCLRQVDRGVGGYERWKQRQLTFRYWNYSDLTHLFQLEAVALRVLEANGSFVPMGELYSIAWNIDTQGAHVKQCTGQAYCKRFAPWVLRNLGPAVQGYLHQKGVAGHHHGQHYFHMCPTSAASAANVRSGYDGLIRSAEARSVEARLRALPVRDYMTLISSRATQRVLRSLVAHVCESKTFLKTTFGFCPASLARAQSKVDLALSLSVKMEEMATVRSDLTTRGQHAFYLKSVREAYMDALADEHAGGWTPIATRCAEAGVDLKQVIEDCANELGQFDYETCEDAVISGTPLDGGAAPIGRDRGSNHASDAGKTVQVLRSENATWENLSRLVTLKVQKVCPELVIPDATLRLQCVARYSRSREGRRHAQGDAAAQVGSHKITSKNEDWNIDMHAGHTMVSYYETLHAELLEALQNFPKINWDDHAKIEADKKRGFTSRRVVTHRNQRKSAPYSDTGKTVALGGAKVVVNSILVTSLPGTDPDRDATKTSSSNRLEVLHVHKQGLAVCRLDDDRRSTPIQQFNDIRFAAAHTSWLRDLLQQPLAFWLSDAGWDHSPRCEEVRWAHTEHHLECDRDGDYFFVRPKGGSGFSEVEHVNAQETIAIAKSGSATATHYGMPSNAEELWRNRLAFLTAVANAVAAAAYACSRLIVMRSYTGADASSDHMSAAEREKLRTVMDTAPSKRAQLPLAARHANTQYYFDKHTTVRHLSCQVRRHECVHSLGRPCRRSDYPYPDELHFKPCEERPLRLPAVPLVPDASPDPDNPGHFRSWAKVKAMVEAGTLDPRAEYALPSLALKKWAKANGLSPSAGQMETFARELLGSAELVGDVDRWFQLKRMERYLKEEEQRQALADPSGAKYAEHVTLRLMSAAAAKVPGITSPFALDDYRTLLGDARVALPTHGGKKEAMARVFANRQHIANMLQLSLAEIESVPSAAERAESDDDDPLTCAVCGDANASDDNPMLKCDGMHDTEVGYHLRCLPVSDELDHVPENDWFCPSCREKSIWQAGAVRGKMKRGKRQLMHYLLHWTGYGSEDDTWEPLANLSTGSKQMVNAYNAELLAEKKAKAAAAAPAFAAPAAARKRKK